MKDQCTQEQFLRDVANHKIEIMRDDGAANRHIRFKRPGTSCYYFDLITWPGHLCVSGDCGTYVFTRLVDMFNFFRTEPSWSDRNPDSLYINKGYWSEKCVSAAVNGGIEEYSEELFKAAIKDHFDRYVESREPEQEVKDELWAEIESEVLVHSDNEYRAYNAAHDFNHNDFEFWDFFENNLKTYTNRFIWNLYAISWGIKQYDAAKQPAEELAA